MFKNDFQNNKSDIHSFITTYQLKLLNYNYQGRK